MSKKVVCIVMDSVGIGALPDADRFGDAGSDTLGHLFDAYPDLHVPNLLALGLGHIDHVRVPRGQAQPIGCYGKAAEQFLGKDTTGGHWEIAGLVLDEPFPTFPNGFPPALIDALTAAIGRGILGNEVASGTEIIQRLGDEHIRTGKPIVYTSADSVLQIAAHEQVIAVEELYRICEIARKLCDGPYRVGRVIARPFVGTSANYTRTPRRKDFSVQPPGDTMLDSICAHGLEVAAVGKIEDIFAHRGITRVLHGTDNAMCIEQTLSFMQQPFSGLIFTNLVDFDMLYGHRNNAEGYARALEQFDAALPNIINALGPDDLLLITADHGCDPTTPSTDHSREYVPILAYGKRLAQNVNLGVRKSFADLAATICAYLGLSWPIGKSFCRELKGEK